MFTLLLTLLAFVSTALASTAGVSPAWIDGPVQPGEPTRFRVSVANQSPGLLVFDAILGDVWYAPDTYASVYPPAGTTPMSAASYASVFPERLSVPSGEVASFVVTVTAPEELPNGLYGALRIKGRPYQSESEGTRAQTSLAFMVPLLLAPETGTTHAMSLQNVAATAPRDTSPGVLRVRLLNEGTVHERPTVRAVVRNSASGSVVATISGESPKFFLPGQQRAVDFQWSADLPPGDYQVLGALRYADAGVVPIETALTVAPPTSPSLPSAPTLLGTGAPDTQ